jgi:putative membrane protein
VTAPGLWTLGWHQWQPVPGLDGLAIIVLVVYVVAARRVSRGWPWLRTASFAAGLGAAIIATQSGYDADDDVLLSVHMIQHLLLLEPAPLLLLGGRPAMLALRAAPRSARPRLARLLMRLRRVTHPLVCLSIFSIVVAGTHLPAFYDATLAHPLLHDGEHALYLTSGLLLWWPLLDGDPVAGRRLSGLLRLTYVMVAMLPMTLLGAYLNRATTVVYHPYLVPARALGISAVNDQQQAGAIMWVLGSLVMVVAGIWQAMAAFAAEERRMRTSERRLDARAARELES